MAKQYRLYNPSTKYLVKSRDVVFYEDMSFFKPAAQKSLSTFTNKSEEPAVSHSPGHERSDILPLLPPPGQTTERVMRKLVPAWVRKPSRVSYGQSTTSSRMRMTSKLSLQERHDIEMNSNLGPYWSRDDGRRRIRDDRVSSKPSGSRIVAERMSEVVLDGNCIREGEGEGEGEERANLIVGYPFMVANGPKSIEEALNSTHRMEGTDAINSEFQSLEGHDTWSVISTSNDTSYDLQTISSGMVSQEKLGKDGQVSRYKARLVAHGLRQRPGIDFAERYTPMISFPAIWMVLSKAAVEDKEIVQLDIVTAFLESEMEKLIYL